MNRTLVALLAVATLLTGACTGNGDGASDPNARQIAIYSALIPAIAAYERPDLAAGGEPLTGVIYVAPKDDATIAIEVQIGVIVALEEWATIRFIDAFEEAIDGGDPDRPVRDATVLIELGPIPDGDASVRLSVDRYEHASELLRFEVQVRRRSGEWTVVEPLEGVALTLDRID